MLVRNHRLISSLLLIAGLLFLIPVAQAANCSMVMGQTDTAHGMTAAQIIDAEAAAGGFTAADLTLAYVVIDYTSNPGTDEAIAVCHDNSSIAAYMGSMMGVFYQPAPQCNVSGPCTATNGSCGTADGVPSPTAPTTNLCADGSTPNVTGTGPWNWTCSGTGGGSDALCSAPASVNGQCGTAHGTPTATSPSTGLCAAGTESAVSGTGPWTWTCNGLGGGTNESCAAPMPPPPPSFGGNCP